MDMKRFIFTLFFTFFTYTSAGNEHFSPPEKCKNRDPRAMAKKLIGQGAYAEAMLQYNASLQTGVALNAEESFEFAYLLFVFGKYEQVVQQLKENKTHPETLYLLGLAYKELGQKDFARASLTKYALQKEGRYHSQALFEQALLASTPEEKRGNLKRLTENREESAASHFARGAAYFELKEYKQAGDAFQRVVEKEPNSPLVPAALYFQAEAKEAFDLKVKIYTDYPNSPFAPTSFFSLYPYNRYIQGDEIAIRHLAELPAKFPDSPVAILANFLLGLDLKRDQKTSSGKITRKKDLLAAIHYFQAAEADYTKLMTHLQIPPTDENYYRTVAQNAMMERALANREIAQEARGAKKRIYFEYALEVLQTLVEREENNFTPLLEEGLFRLAETHHLLKNEAESEKMALSLLEQYQKRKITRATYLSKTRSLLGNQKMVEGKREEAYLYYTQAEEAARGGLISDEERLALWMQMSLCLKEMGDTDGAIRLLSQVINEDVVSKIRLQAMLMRADIYKAEGRTEIANKQYEALSKIEE